MCCCAGNKTETCGAVGFLELFVLAGVACEAGVALGLGRIVTLHCCSSTSCQIHYAIRCLCFCNGNAAAP